MGLPLLLNVAGGHGRHCSCLFLGHEDKSHEDVGCCTAASSTILTEWCRFRPFTFGTTSWPTTKIRTTSDARQAQDNSDCTDALDGSDNRFINVV